MHILIAYDSLSGNTRELARRIRARCEALGHAVDWIDTGVQALADAGPDPRHDLYLLGTWTDNAGRTPPEMKRFIADLVEAIGRPERLAVFGTGETQWGEEYWCGALRRMAGFFASRYPRLEIEQMPHGEADDMKVLRWIDEVLDIAMGRGDGPHGGRQVRPGPVPSPMPVANPAP